MQQIPEEGRLFQIVDKNWKEVMCHCVKNSKVLVKYLLVSTEKKILIKKKPNILFESTL